MAVIGSVFRPDPDARKLYRVYLLIPALFFLIPLLAGGATILLYVAAPLSLLAVAVLFAPYLAVVGFVAYWIPRYLSTVSYALLDDRMAFEGGLWWKRKSFVPYNRVTNVDLMQGPLSRRYSLGKVSIQTAGYSGQSNSATRLAEMAIFAVKDFEGIKNTIMEMVVKLRPVAVEAGVETPHEATDAEMLEELRRIRKGIEGLSKAR